MNIEFRIPISPNTAFYSQLRLFGLSLSRLGPPYSSAKIMVSVGDGAQLETIARQNQWAEDFPIVWSVVPPDVCQQFSGLASGFWRYAPPSDADVIILSDADTCIVAPFAGLLAQMTRTDSAVAGLQAHYSPFAGGDNEESWRKLLSAIGKEDVHFHHGYSMDVGRSQGTAPPYFNYGFVAFNAHAFARISAVMEKCLTISQIIFPKMFYIAQLALTLAIIQTEAFPIMLGHEYNCANDDVLIKHNLVDINCIHVIHYLRKNEFDRHMFLCDGNKFQEFLKTKENQISEMLRNHVNSIPNAFIEWKK